MAKPIGEYSLSDLCHLADHMPSVGNWPKRILADTYKAFVDVLNDDLDQIVSGFQLNPELLRDDGEDRLTTEIKRSLNLLGYTATHDEKIGGHSDLAVKGKKDFLWIGEAKIHSSYDYLYQGFQQLSTRYATGDHNQDCGGFIVYIKNLDAATVFSRWRVHLREKLITEYNEYDSDKRSDFVFFTTHKHDRSGRLFNVRHVGVILAFEPKDRK